MKEKQNKAGGGPAEGGRKKEDLSKISRYPGIQMARTGRWLRFVCKIHSIPVKKICECLGPGMSPVGLWLVWRENTAISGQLLHVKPDAAHAPR